ncbi:hypothetical protein Clacol_006359 [Clathrus columnatus]|uniref:mitogen-activated protein kinase kinase kinase n=1 Tax=Clathrus columnatus TaxID=1419009 RepID=A0AAV5AHF0_9AGAM|nr:hypothetical protein Clacol_006359 [Clathrus columnatus]
MSMEIPTYLDTGSPHGSTPTSPSFNVTPATRQQSHLRSKSHSRPDTPNQQPQNYQGLPSTVSLESPSGVLFADFLRQWNDVHVSRWLVENKCAQHAQTFAANDIRGDVLLDLDQSALREMGITAVGDRIKILNGVKALRAKVSSGKAAKHTQSTKDTRLLNGRLQIESQLPSDSSGPRKRIESTRPPPLQLSKAATPGLPQIIRSSGSHNPTSTVDASRSNIKSSIILPVNPGHTHTHSGSSTKDSYGMIRGLPPLPPPPGVQFPMAPRSATGTSQQQNTPINSTPGSRNLLFPQVTSGRRTPTPAGSPPPFTRDPLPPAPHQTPTLPTNGWSGEYNLPRGPSPGNMGGSRPTTGNRSSSNSPLPSHPSRARALPLQANTHGRSASASNSHPYANLQATLQPPPNSNNAVLSPIREDFLTPTSNTSTSNATNSSYTSRGLMRSSTPLSRAPMTAEDIRRKCVKFVLAEGGHSRLLNVEDKSRGAEILEFVLRKFGNAGNIIFPSNNLSDDLDSIDPNEPLIVDNWGVFLHDGSPDSPGKHLNETELILICHDEQNPAREAGLTIRRVKSRKNKDIAKYFGVNDAVAQDARTPSPIEFPTLKQSSNATDTRAVKQMNRASSISILSSLGVPDPVRTLAPPVPPLPSDSPTKPASPTPSTQGKTQGKLRNFRGHRPPSELITTHLQEYFPYTEKKILERTQRQSMMFRSGRADSIRSFSDGRRLSSRQSWLPPNEGDPNPYSSPPLPSVSLLPDSQSVRSMQSGKSMISSKSVLSGKSTLSAMSDELHSGKTTEGHDEPIQSPIPRVPVQPLLLPPVQFPTETETLSETMNKVGRRFGRTNSNASRRTSRLSIRRSTAGVDRSDTASMLTVDEITQEVESRRVSMLTESGPDVTDEGSNTAVETYAEDESTAVNEESSEIMIKQEEIVEEDMEEDEDEDEEEEEEEEGEAEAEEEHKAVTSNGGKRPIKWIRGALIGAGSFGSVYLGMDAHRGLLMAVKQVEIPTGSAPNEERKKSMLSALEREIELLKTLQHENIVQYLDSSNDSVHLNIFLEYVPGGSVATLLKNYGAFEEALVRNFVRQILQGLNYLHERDIIHRDIKGGNILVDNKGGIKISDFGISKKVEDTMLTGARVHRPSLQGSVFWMAPEVVKQTAYTIKADIWSLGCLIVEMLTGEHPWAQLTQMQAIFKIGSSAKPTVPSDISTDAEDFLHQTFELDHNKRPTATELLHDAWIVNDPANLAYVTTDTTTTNKTKVSKSVPEVTVSA